MAFVLEQGVRYCLEAWQELPWLFHGFTTRAAGDFGGPAPSGDAAAGLGAPGMQLVTVRQVHSPRIETLDGGELWGEAERPQADGLISRRPGVLLGVRVADCFPLLFLDRRRRVGAAVHAGWRGTAQGIAARAVERLQTEFGCPAAELEVALGPGIEACCFEVGPEVAEGFAPDLIVEGARPRVDLREANRRQLIAAGVSPQHIRAVGECTRCRADRFHSHRRDGAAAGRMLAVIGIRPDQAG